MGAVHLGARKQLVDIGAHHVFEEHEGVRAVAERLGTVRILTFDRRDFRVLRAGRRPFLLLPEDA